MRTVFKILVIVSYLGLCCVCVGENCECVKGKIRNMEVMADGT